MLERMRRARDILICGITAFGLCAAWPAAGAGPQESSEIKPSTGETLARVYCGSCHTFPEPDLLDKGTWRDQTLPRMSIRLGLSPQMIDKHPEAALLRASGVFPTSPMISDADWAAVIDYYLQKAPEKPLPQEPHPQITPGLELFTIEKPRHKMPVPSTTMVKISERERKVYMGDAETKALGVYTFDGKPPTSMQLANIPVSLTESDRGIYLTMIGKFFPSEEPRGAFAFLERAGERFGPPQMIVTNVVRPTHAEFADLNGDGRTDVVFSEYGNNVGKFCWYENLGGEKYREQVLLPRSGAVRSAVHDFNGDKTPDIAVLIAQEQETLYLLLNDGHARFSTNTIVFNKPPIYGHSGFELVDFNKDGLQDFLVTNGDNGEYPSPTKRYHGVRLYLNRGNLKFDEAFFFPLNGAFAAKARDFDQDGDVDIAATSFFPDYDRTPQESFVYLENKGSMQFRALTFPQCTMGRWLVMDAGDLDADGDIDLVLGSYINGPSDVPALLKRDWDRFSPSILVLRNKARSPK
jgi:mono/diheme cytochrome c family protein